MRREPVESTSIASMGYDRRSATLEIEFAGGGVYRYLAVSERTWERLRAAESKGRFVNGSVKPYHRVVRVS
jgi:KTSC domain